MAGLDIFEEANRQLTICNACRYCEGLCPVFPALELYRTFTPNDIRYLGNLCHDCRACQQACMYTEPHEFAMNFPKVMSEARMESYEHWSWPAFLARSFSDTPKGVLLGVGAAVIVCVASLFFLPPHRLLAIHSGPGAFYQVVPYLAMVIPALVLFLYGAAIWLQGSIRFWSESGSAVTYREHGLAPLLRGFWDSITVKHMGGGDGGGGCWYPGDRPADSPSSIRRVFHSLVVWGFLSDLVSTTLAFIYQDFLHLMPPYPLRSAPVIFGVAGGVGLIIGTAGLLWFKLKSDRSLSARAAYSLDYAFLIFLGLAALSGMLTLILRSTAAMGSILVIHLAIVAALFITAPYGKFVHFVYRFLALVRYEIEIQGATKQGVGH